MSVRNGYERLDELLSDYVSPLGMTANCGPLRAMGDLVRGIALGGSVQVTDAARLIASTPGELSAAVKRISEHLSDRHFDHRPWAGAILALQAGKIADDDLIPLDATELAKPYARHMQHQCIVRDASQPGDPLVSGYWCLGAHHWSPTRETLTPLMLRPYSQTMPQFKSENDQWLQYFWTLRQATGGRGIWLIDRGSDRPDILAGLRMQPRWIVRLMENRPLRGPDGTCRSAGEWANWALAHQSPRGHAVRVPVHLVLPQFAKVIEELPLNLLVPTYGFFRNGKPDRWLLLTRGLTSSHVGPRQTRLFYGRRWRAEDAKRFVGQIWHAERFLTRNFLALERMLWCVCLAGGFIAELQREEPALARQLEQKILYWDKPYTLACYRVARGLQATTATSGPPMLLKNA
jgi:hypothetical protein